MLKGDPFGLGGHVVKILSVSKKNDTVKVKDTMSRKIGYYETDCFDGVWSRKK